MLAQRQCSAAQQQRSGGPMAAAAASSSSSRGVVGPAHRRVAVASSAATSSGRARAQGRRAVVVQAVSEVLLCAAAACACASAAPDDLKGMQLPPPQLHCARHTRRSILTMEAFAACSALASTPRLSVLGAAATAARTQRALRFAAARSPLLAARGAIGPAQRPSDRSHHHHHLYSSPATPPRHTRDSASCRTCARSSGRRPARRRTSRRASSRSASSTWACRSTRPSPS